MNKKDQALIFVIPFAGCSEQAARRRASDVPAKEHKAASPMLNFILFKAGKLNGRLPEKILS